MISVQTLLQSVKKMTVTKRVINTLNHMLKNNKMRFFATETAVQNITIRKMLKPKKTTLNAGSWFLLVIPASAFGLGTWQVFRKFEKDKVNEEYMKLIEQPPVDLPKNLDDLKDMDYRKVRVRGRFDHSKELYFGPRAKVDDSIEKLTLSLFSTSNAGYLIVTPFKLSDRDLTILVNRGWVPPEQKHSSARPEGQISEEVEIVGSIRLQEKREPLGVKNLPEKKVFVYRDINKMSELTGAAPVYIEADKSSTVPGGPIGGQTIIGLRNDHFSYIVTWYGLSIVSGYLWYLRHFPSPRIIV